MLSKDFSAESEGSEKRIATEYIRQIIVII